MNRLEEMKDDLRMSGSDRTAPHNTIEALYPFSDKYLNKKQTIVEIGTFEGVSTELFAIKCKKVITIDPYELGDNLRQDGGEEILRQAEQRAITRLKDYSNVIMIKKMNENVVSLYKDLSIDVVYTDGNHNYENVILDNENWFPKIKIGGFIAGHDYYENVKKAVNDILGEPDEVFLESTWIFKKTESLKIRGKNV